MRCKCILRSPRHRYPVTYEVPQQEPNLPPARNNTYSGACRKPTDPVGATLQHRQRDYVCDITVHLSGYRVATSPNRQPLRMVRCSCGASQGVQLRQLRYVHKLQGTLDSSLVSAKSSFSLPTVGWQTINPRVEFDSLTVASLLAEKGPHCVDYVVLWQDPEKDQVMSHSSCLHY
jgi:hypothetical protein